MANEWMKTAVIDIVAKRPSKLSHLGFSLGLLDEARVVAPVVAADQSQHERGHELNLFRRRRRMHWTHRRQPVLGSRVRCQLGALKSRELTPIN